MSMVIVREVRRHSAIGLTTRKLDEIRELARRMTSAREQYIADYWSPRYAARVLASSRAIRAERRRDGWAQPQLRAQHNVMALESALGVLRSGWRATCARVRRLIGRNPRLSREEKDWILAALRDPQCLQVCLDGGVPPLGSADSTIDRRVLSRKLRRLLLRYRTERPRPGRSLWFEIDTNLYRPFVRAEDRHFKGAWLAISGLTKGRRICVPLAGSGLEQFAARTEKRHSWPGLRIEVRERIAFNSVVRIRPTPRAGTIEAGLDKGYRTLVTLTTSDASAALGYGEGARSLIAKVADDSVERLKQRRRLAAHERSLRNSESPAARRKARRIRRANLGRARVDRGARRDRTMLRGQIGRALNEMFLSHPEIGVLHVEDLGSLSKRLSARMNRYLGRWLKGYLHLRLRQKAELNGVGLNVVNAAYTSQTCPRCWFTTSGNRIGERFECRSCGFTGSSDAVAATNVLTRGRDPAVSRFTPKRLVKQTLDARWRSALTGGAWGSNDENEVFRAEPRTGSYRFGDQDLIHALRSHRSRRTQTASLSRMN